MEYPMIRFTLSDLQLATLHQPDSSCFEELSISVNHVFLTLVCLRTRTQRQIWVQIYWPDST